MAKRRSKRRRSSIFNIKAPWSRRRSGPTLEEALAEADRLIASGRAEEAAARLEPLLADHARSADLHYYVGYARAKAGDGLGGIAGYERAMELSKDQGYWLPLASLYLEVGFNSLALHAFRQFLKHEPDHPMSQQAEKTMAKLEEDVAAFARDQGVPVGQAEKGLVHLDRGQRALRTGDYAGCAAANRQAIKTLPAWLPPQNNLSLALFYNGEPEEAIATARGVLEKDPENIQALSNAIRFLAWTGREEEAGPLWAKLKGLAPTYSTERIKIAEAAAIMEKDEQVYDLLKPLDRGGSPPEAAQTVKFFLATAEANLGQRRQARRRLKSLPAGSPERELLESGLKANRAGPGWADRYPYFHFKELAPREAMEDFGELLAREEEMRVDKFEREMGRFVSRFPQVVLVAEKLIWEMKQAEAGIGMLAAIGTPRAYAALRRFGLSQAGDDETRMRALITLVEAGEIGEDEPVRIWHGGEWREVFLRQQEIVEESRSEYEPEVAELLNEGLAAFKGGDEKRAERLFRRALKLAPEAKEGYNNLGAIYAKRGEHEQAREMFRAAAEIDPTYAFPRCNLALYLLDERDVEGAEEVLKPLAEARQFHAQEMAFYSYAQARILVEKKEYEEARKVLETALEVLPGYELAENLLDRLDNPFLQPAFTDFFERQRARDRPRRVKLQAKLSSPSPSLSETLPLYSKDALTATARIALPEGGWSGMRKAPLIEEIVKGLTGRERLKRIVGNLREEERAALGQVLDQGGAMAWEAFDSQYGNDLDESFYWQWHEPETTMGRLRLRGLLAEATVDGETLVVIPADLRGVLGEVLGRE